MIAAASSMPLHAVEYPVQYIDEAVKKDISQRMTRILRHKAGKYGIPIAADGYVKVEHLLQARNLQGTTSEELIAVAESSFKRQEARFELADFEDGVYIRAMRKHSMAQVDLRLLATERASRRQQLPRAHRTDPAFVPPPPNDPPPPRDNDSARQAPTENGAPVAVSPPVSAWSLLPAPALDPRTTTPVRTTTAAEIAMPEPLPQITAAETTMAQNSSPHNGEAQFAATEPVIQPTPPLWPAPVEAAEMPEVPPQTIAAETTTTQNSIGHSGEAQPAAIEPVCQLPPPLRPPPVELLQGMPSSGPPPLAIERNGKVVENFDGEAWATQGGYLTLTEGMHITLLPHPEAGHGWAFGRIEGLDRDASSRGEVGWLPENYFEACSQDP